MSVVSCTPLLTDAGQWTGEESEGYERKYTASYQVICSDKQDGPAVVLTAGGLPALYSAYALGNDSHAAALCVKRTPRLVTRSQAGNVWAVDCEFSTATSTNQQNGDPTQWLPKISGSFAQFTRALEQDLDGRPIANAAGEVFDPVPEIEDSRPTLVVSKIFSSFDYVFFCDYRDKVNSDNWNVRGLVFPPDYLKMRNMSFAETFINGESYFEVTAEMEVKPDKWNPRKWLNIGYKSLWPVNEDGAPTAESKPTLIIDPYTGLPTTTPLRLKADGTVELNLDADPVFIERDVYERRPFAALNLT